MARLSEKLRWVFWEVDFDSLDPHRDGDYILARLLEFGGMEEVRWLIATYGLERIHDFFRDVGHPEISDRTTCFWRAVFKAEDEVWASPPAWRRTRSVPWVG